MRSQKVKVDKMQSSGDVKSVLVTLITAAKTGSCPQSSPLRMHTLSKALEDFQRNKLGVSKLPFVYTYTTSLRQGADSVGIHGRPVRWFLSLPI